MQLLENAWPGGTNLTTNSFTMQKLGTFTVKITADSWTSEVLTMQSSPDGTLWDTYAPDGVAELYTGTTDNDATRSYTDGPAWFRFIGDNGDSGAADIHIWVGGNGLTLNSPEATFS